MITWKNVQPENSAIRHPGEDVYLECIFCDMCIYDFTDFESLTYHEIIPFIH